ncbi:UNVERIFIED_CONTAM: hypothetical protein K2H54_025516 [Gekko kuhli]
MGANGLPKMKDNWTFPPAVDHPNFFWAWLSAKSARDLERLFAVFLMLKWLNPLFVLGHKRRLDEDDMYKVLPEDSSKVLGEGLQWYWDKEVQKAKKEARVPHLTKAIILCYWKSYLALGLFTLIEGTTSFVAPTVTSDLKFGVGSCCY